MLAITLLVTMLVIRLAPRSAAAQVLHRYFVAFPAGQFARLERKHLIFLFVALSMLFAVETIALLGSVDLAMVAAWDASIYIDLVVATWSLAAVTRMKGGWTAVKALVTRAPKSATRRVGRQPHTRPSRTGMPPANDDDGPEWRRLAA